MASPLEAGPPAHEPTCPILPTGSQGEERMERGGILLRSPERTLWVVMLCLMAVFPTPSRTLGQDFPPEETVRRILGERVALGRNPGIVVGLLDRNGPRVVAVGTSGTEGVEMDGHTVFEIGSITKVFTAAVLQDKIGRAHV